MSEELQEPFLVTEKPICVKKAIEALNEIILSELVCTEERQILKLIRFKQWLIDQN